MCTICIVCTLVLDNCPCKRDRGLICSLPLPAAARRRDFVAVRARPGTRHDHSPPGPASHPSVRLRAPAPALCPRRRPVLSFLSSNSLPLPGAVPRRDIRSIRHPSYGMMGEGQRDFASIRPSVMVARAGCRPLIKHAARHSLAPSVP